MNYLFVDEWTNFYTKTEITEDDKYMVEQDVLDIFDLKNEKRLTADGWVDIPTWDDFQSGS